MFSVHFLSIEELNLLVFGCSMFGFLDKRVIFISFRVFFCLFFHIKELPLLVLSVLCLFFHINEVPLFSKICKKHGRLSYV